MSTVCLTYSAFLRTIQQKITLPERSYAHTLLTYRKNVFTANIEIHKGFSKKKISIEKEKTTLIFCMRFNQLCDEIKLLIKKGNGKVFAFDYGIVFPLLAD